MYIFWFYRVSYQCVFAFLFHRFDTYLWYSGRRVSIRLLLLFFRLLSPFLLLLLFSLVFLPVDIFAYLHFVCFLTCTLNVFLLLLMVIWFSCCCYSCLTILHFFFYWFSLLLSFRVFKLHRIYRRQLAHIYFIHMCWNSIHIYLSRSIIELLTCRRDCIDWNEPLKLIVNKLTSLTVFIKIRMNTSDLKDSNTNDFVEICKCQHALKVLDKMLQKFMVNNMLMKNDTTHDYFFCDLFMMIGRQIKQINVTFVFFFTF